MALAARAFVNSEAIWGAARFDKTIAVDAYLKDRGFHFVNAQG
jgi:hypothetical protein